MKAIGNTTARAHSSSASAARRARFGLVAGAATVVLGVSAGAAGIAGAAVHADHGRGNHPTKPAPVKSSAALAGIATAAPTTSTATPPVTSFTVEQNKKRSFTVVLTSSTVFVEHGVSSPTGTDILPGERVVVRGAWDTSASKTIDASSVRIIPAHPHTYPGVVTVAPSTPDSSGNASFTIKHGKTLLTIDVTGATTYTAKGVTGATLNNVVVGAHVNVWGTSSWPRTTIMAKVVHVIHVPTP